MDEVARHVVFLLQLRELLGGAATPRTSNWSNEGWGQGWEDWSNEEWGRLEGGQMWCRWWLGPRMGLVILCLCKTQMAPEYAIYWHTFLTADPAEDTPAITHIAEDLPGYSYGSSRLLKLAGPLAVGRAKTAKRVCKLYSGDFSCVWQFVAVQG